jgi:uncharacterized membrane protein YkvA (DUF1232 family)
MARKDKRITPADEGFFREIANQVRLVIRLIADPRVNIWIKLLPIGSLIYLVFPFDFLPIFPIDDAVVIGLGTYMFIELCPPDVVREHKEALNQVVSGVWKDVQDDKDKIDEADVVEGEFRDS